MENHQIVPDKVTKPIQLLAAWLVGLILVNASFLLAAQQITHPSWGSAVLLISAVANVPIFIGALFLLQTKFRPQMQEDSFYSKYLEFEKAPLRSEEASDFLKSQMEKAVTEIVSALGMGKEQDQATVAEILEKSSIEVFVYKHGTRRTLSELFLCIEMWPRVVEKWQDNNSFIKSTDALIEDGLIVKSESYSSARLTDVGRKVAEMAESRGLLFSQKKKIRWKETREDLAQDD
ncbi:MAG: hypothetical protein ABL934_05900 [Lysobacteraceae bacterium]